MYAVCSINILRLFSAGIASCELGAGRRIQAQPVRPASLVMRQTEAALATCQSVQKLVRARDGA